MTSILAASLNKPKTRRIYIRRDLVIPSGQTRRTVSRSHPVKLAARQRDYKRAVAEEAGIPANVPMRHYMPSDRIELAQPPRRPASLREAIPGINCPGPGETWEDIRKFREAYGLPPVVALIG